MERSALGFKGLTKYFTFIQHGFHNRERPASTLDSVLPLAHLHHKSAVSQLLIPTAPYGSTQPKQPPESIIVKAFMQSGQSKVEKNTATEGRN
jgi:hypothetical protein